MYFGFAILICSFEMCESIWGWEEARTVTIEDIIKGRHNLPLFPFLLCAMDVCVSLSFTFHHCY